jgi:phosphoribosylformimino-5-aminoimidazole carboxamide ribotide isomerase
MILPAIDIYNEQCVRLRKGDFSNVTIYGSPVEIAEKLIDRGYNRMHLVDLNGAKDGFFTNWKVVKEIVSMGVFLQVAGGVRDRATAEQLLNLGVGRVVFGSLSIQYQKQVRAIIKDLGKDKISFFWDGKKVNDQFTLFTHGWCQKSDIGIGELIDAFGDSIPDIVFVTDINRDGRLLGVNESLYQFLKAKYPHVRWGASGGVKDLNEVNQLAPYVSEVVVGKKILDSMTKVERAC